MQKMIGIQTGESSALRQQNFLENETESAMHCANKIKHAPIG